MTYVYVPDPRAREYAPYGFHGPYDVCNHHCRYCYLQKYQRNWGTEPTPKVDFIKLDRELLKFAPTDPDRVLLSFSCDPYCKEELEYEHTQRVIQILSWHKVLVCVLTKNPELALRDIDIFPKGIHMGATLTFIDEDASRHWEPRAELPSQRIAALEKFHDAGIFTWASLEPVIDPQQTLEILRRTVEIIDHYKVGKLNHYPEIERKIDWGAFLRDVEQELQGSKATYYIKTDLAKAAQSM